MVREVQELSLTRKKIIEQILTEPKTISHLSKILNLGRTTIYHHLDFLRSKGLVKGQTLEKKHGNPVLIHFVLSKKIKKIMLEIINYAESFRKGAFQFGKSKAPSKITRDHIKEKINCLEEDFEIAYGLLEMYKAIGIVVTTQGIELKKVLTS